MKGLGPRIILDSLREARQAYSDEYLSNIFSFYQMICRFCKILALGLFMVAMGTPSANAFLGFSSRSSDKKVLNAEELSSQETKASAALVKARDYEQAGKIRQARDVYKDITKNYARTDAAAEAKYGYARMLETGGDGRKAFDQYQELVTNYRNSPNFNEAISRQYAIADALRNSKKKGFLGIGSAIQPSKLIEMFEKISTTAPFTEWAPKSLLNVGYVQTGLGETDAAIAAFQKVVEKYPGTDYAKEGQYQVFKLRGVTAEKSNSPLKDRAQAEAGLDFLNQNPSDQRTAEVRADLQQIEEKSMEKLYDTGVFYEKSGKVESARVYYREVVKNPNSAWAAKAQQRLAALDSTQPENKEKGPKINLNPLKKDKVEMRTSDDSVVPLPNQTQAASE